MSNISTPNLHPLLTIGDLAAQVGVKPATLREWERRHGFPEPERLPSGHRRYPTSTVADVRAVLERQRAGLSLASAIATVRAEHTGRSNDSSLFAAASAVSRRPPTRMSRGAMLAFSRAIEDACAASGSPAVLVGCFQRAAVYRACERRWRELGRSARACVALADFDDPSVDGPVIEVPIPAQSPLHREWAVAVATPGLHGCLVGWEWPGGGDGFEALWSVDAAVVRAVIDAALAVARTGLPGHLPPVVDVDDVSTATDADATMRLLDRVIERLDR